MNAAKGKLQSFNLKNIPVSEWKKLKIIHLREGEGETLSDFVIHIIMDYINTYIGRHKVESRPIKEEEFDDMERKIVDSDIRNDDYGIE